MEGANCFFDSNDSTLSAAAMIALDSFASRARKNPSAAFIIAGHTDCEIADIIYRNLLLSVFAGKKDQAFKILNIWLQVAKPSGKIHLLFDPRLVALTSDRRWAALAVKKVRESYRTRKKPLLAYQLDSLGAEDQKCRTLKHYVENLHAYRAAIDSTDRRFDVHYFPDTADYLCAARDEEHGQALQKLIGYHDWPKISEVGTRPAKTAFLIVAHSDSTHIAHYLPLLKQSCTEGEAEGFYYATLYDRLRPAPTLWHPVPTCPR